MQKFLSLLGVIWISMLSLSLAADPKVKFMPGEKELLDQVRQLKSKAQFRMASAEELAAMSKAIEELWSRKYTGLSKEQKYSRLLMIAQGNATENVSGEVQVGAAAYLAVMEDPAVVPYLEKGTSVESPDGVSLECYRGIGRHLRGEGMMKIVKMLESPVAKESNYAFHMINAFHRKEQLEELRKCRDKMAESKWKVFVSDMIAQMSRSILAD